jgi:hypothetical protein
VLKKIIRKIRNRSIDGAFVFEIECDCCRQTYKTMPIPYESLLETPEEAFDNALHQALIDFSDNFNQCSVCGQIICNRCLTVCSAGSVCKDCAARLHSSVKPVNRA